MATGGLLGHSFGTNETAIPTEGLLLGYLDTWSGFEAAKTAPWMNQGLNHFGKFLEPSDE